MPERGNEAKRDSEVKRDSEAPNHIALIHDTWQNMKILRIQSPDHQYFLYTCS